MIAAIDLGQIGKVIWVSLVAGVLITTAYAVVVFSSARWLQARREGQTAAAAVVIGLHIMLSKS